MLLLLVAGDSLGAILYFECSGACYTACAAAAAALPAGFGANCLASCSYRHAASVTIQCASLAFWLPVEIYQMDTLGHPTFVVFLRFKNIAAFALGKRETWGLKHAQYVCRSVGCSSHHSMEFSAVALRHIALLHSGQLMFSMLYGRL